MKVSGFTVIRNAKIMGYPVVESIRSLLPIVDELIVGVGQSDDQTKELILQIPDSKTNPKIKIFNSHWDTAKTSGGLILSEKTNEAMRYCTGDWCFYLQADEVIHENDYDLFKQAMRDNLEDKKVEGLLSPYLHFYGGYNVIATARNWYRNEVRIVRNNPTIFSHGDAQGFRVKNVDGTMRKPFVKTAGGRVFHYGWVKPPDKMGEKNKHMFRWWHGDKYDDSFSDFAYKSNGYGLKSFQQTHPALMEKLVKSQNWNFKPSVMSFSSLLRWSRKDFKNWSSDVIEKITGHRLGEYKNYRLMK